MSTTAIDTMSDEEFAKYMETGQAEEDLAETEEEAVVDEGATEEETEEVVEEEIEEDESNPEAEVEEEGTEEEVVEEPEEEESTEENDVATEEEEETPKEEQSPKEEEVVKDEDKKYKVKSNGMEFEFTVDELLAMAPRGLDYTKKTQELAPWRRAISALKEAGIEPDSVNKLIDLNKGDKGALASVLQKSEIDPMELDVEKEIEGYRPQQYGKTEAELEVEDIVNEISVDQEFPITQHIIQKQWDDMSRNAFAEKPALIRKLHVDVRDGVYDKVYPIALKMKAMYPDSTKSDLDYYVAAGRQFYADREAQSKARAAEEQARIEAERAKAQQVERVKSMETERTERQTSASRRKAAAITKSTAGKRDVTDYLDMDTMSDEEFNNWMEKRL